MPDPLDVLRTPVPAVEPDPAFRADLRARLERALLTEATVLIPYLAVDDARRALEFYPAAFGARLLGTPIEMDDGRIGHAELDFGGAKLMLADEFGEIGLLGPNARGGPSQSLMIEVADVDAAITRAAGAGARVERAAADYPHGRNGTVVDPFGHRWMVSSRSPSPAATLVDTGPDHGDLAHVIHSAPDESAFRAFYGSVLGWRFGPDSIVENTVPPAGVVGGPSSVVLRYEVSDLAAALDRVRAAGGTAGEPSDAAYGRIAECVDDQGTRFQLLQS